MTASRAIERIHDDGSVHADRDRFDPDRDSDKPGAPRGEPGAPRAQSPQAPEARSQV